MVRVLVVYYSAFGHVEAMAEAVAEGAKSAGAQVDLCRVAELLPAHVVERMRIKVDQPAPIADPATLADYDAVIAGCPTHFGRMPAQMAMFWDQTGLLWKQSALVGKVGAAFTASGSQHGGQEATLLSILNNMMSQGMIVTGLPSTFKGQMGVDEVRGGTPFGASTTAGGDGSRMPSESELDGARFLGAHITAIAAKQVA